MLLNLQQLSVALPGSWTQALRLPTAFAGSIAIRLDAIESGGSSGAAACRVALQKS
jgi:hypothetical protein